MSTLTMLQSKSLPLHPYHSEEFANREDELDPVDERMYEGLWGRKIPQPVVIYWGVNGIGKSWLLHHLAHKYRFPLCERPPGARKDPFSALTDFKDEFSLTLEGWGQLLSTMVTQVADQLDGRIAPAAKALTAFRQAAEAVSAGRGTLDELAEHFTAFINTLSDEFVPLLLFDSMEVLEEEYPDHFYWFEEHIVAPLVRYDQVLTAFAARRELRHWRQFEVRRRIRRVPLDPFSREDIQEQFKKAQIRDFALVGNVIYPYTFGHPYAAWYLQSQLEALRPPSEPFDQRFVAARHPEVAAALGEIEEWLLEPLPVKLRTQLRQASVLRKFHINSLRFILAELLEDETYSKRSDSFFLDLIGQMVVTNLVRYSSAHQGYIADRTVRRLLNLRVQLQEPDEYRRRHTKALELYKNWTNRLPENCGGFLIEAIFHTTARARANGWPPEAAWQEIETLLNKALQPDKFDLEGADFLVEELRRDDELQEMLSEPPLEKAKLFDNLLVRTEDFREQVKERWG